jgi:hypothetical protein
MLRNAKLAISLTVIGVLSVAGVVGWVTGCFSRAAAFLGGTWKGFVALLSSPVNWNDLIAGAGALLAPVVLLLVIISMTDD